MRLFGFLLLALITLPSFAQDSYDTSRSFFHEGQLDSARFYINKNLTSKPTAEDYFLSGMIHEAENKSLRALADYEAVIQRDPMNLEAYFQKGLIYYNSASLDQAISDFTFVIDNQSKSETKAIYYGNDPTGSKGTFLTTLQSMVGRVHQYRGMAHQKAGNHQKALSDFSKSLEYERQADSYINRSQLYSTMGNDDQAISDLKEAISLEPDNYIAWYNLALLDESTRLPDVLLADGDFIPMLNLLGANAYESKEYTLAMQYYTKSIEHNKYDDLALIGRGKVFLRIKEYAKGRKDFLSALQMNPQRVESFYLIGNSFFYENKFEEAIGFYDQYLSVDQSYANVWYNAAMSHLSMKNKRKSCLYLGKALDLGMEAAVDMIEKHCEKQ